MADNVKTRRDRMIAKRRLFARKLKMDRGGACEYCGFDDIRALIWHHRDPDTKEFGLSNFDKANHEKLEKEAAKCDLICSNCHMILHSRERDGG